ncbi:MAG: cytochrome c biogenesis protein CcsA [Ignavibacteria bacterium]|nr:cytochrome c biogenesis protein CcsA [Ignavibacteria bacterium]
MDANLLQLAKSIAEVFLPILYVVTAIGYGMAFFRDDAMARQWKSRLLLATTATHFAYIGLHTASEGHCMVTTPFEMMSLVAFTLIATYTVIEFKTSVKGTGFFLVTLAGAFELVSSVMLKVTTGGEMNPVLSNLGIGLHVTAAIFGFGGIAISAVYGLLYLLLFGELKRSDFGKFFKHLPSLESLERLNTAASIIGFAFLTVAIGIGVFWLPRTFANFSYLDPKLLATALVWCVYAAVLFAKYVLKLDGRRVIRLSIGGFVLAIFSLTVVNAFFSHFHKFY